MPNLEASLKAFIDTAREIAAGGETAHQVFGELSISLKRLITLQRRTIRRETDQNNIPIGETEEISEEGWDRKNLREEVINPYFEKSFEHLNSIYKNQAETRRLIFRISLLIFTTLTLIFFLLPMLEKSYTNIALSFISEPVKLGSWMESFLANLLSGAIVAIIFGIFVYKWIETKERWKEKRSNQKVIANLIASELEYNKGQLEKLITELPKGSLVFPCLEASVWDIIDKTEFLSFYQKKNIEDILNIYRRIKTTNEMYGFLLKESKWVVKGEITEVRKEFIDAFITRCEELKSYLDNFFNEIAARRQPKNKNL